MTARRQTLAFFAAALLATLATPQPVLAQSPYNPIAVQVPFSFENGSHHLPPGRYTVSLTLEHFLFVRGDRDGTNFMVQADQSLSPAAKGKLVFTRYGNRYFLREVWTAGSSTHVLCRKSSEEKQLQQLIAQSNATPPAEQVALLAASR